MKRLFRPHSVFSAIGGNIETGMKAGRKVTGKEAPPKSDAAGKVKNCEVAGFDWVLISRPGETWLWQVKL